MTFRGDFRGLGQLGRNVEQLARVPSRVASSSATAIRGRLEEQFTEGKDPYGRPWAPLKPATVKAGRHNPPLTDTRKMRDHDLDVRPMGGAGIAITFNPNAPALFHQKGTPTMEARPILPTGTMPASWNRALEDASTQSVVKAMGRR